MKPIFTILVLLGLACPLFAQVPSSFTATYDGVILQVTLDPVNHAIGLPQRTPNSAERYTYLVPIDIDDLAAWIHEGAYLYNGLRYKISPDNAQRLARKIRTALNLDPPAPAAPVPPAYPISAITIKSDTSHIFLQLDETAPIETFTLRLDRDSVPQTENTITIPFDIISSHTAYIPILEHASKTITADQWLTDPDTKKKYCIVRLEMHNPKIDQIQQATLHIVIRNGNANSYVILADAPLSRSPNFFVGSFIKSISATDVPNELLDIMVKVNLSPRRIGNHPLVFAMIGADAGLKSDTTGGVTLLNEAMVNVNRTLGRIYPSTRRIGFLGGGLKVFDHEAYLGAHLGLMELHGILQNTYILAGYYYSPWLGSTQNRIPKDTALKFRHNLYFEAAFNAFGDNAPKALQLIRLKFGLMLPIAIGSNKDGAIKGDNVIPTSKDFLYRLAVEVPIGGPIKF